MNTYGICFFTTIACTTVLMYMGYFLHFYQSGRIQCLFSRINDPLERNVNPTSASYGYWSSIICSISTSTYMMAAILRKYLDFTSYYISIGVAIVNTVIMLVLSKHLWRAYWIKSPHKQNAQNQASKDSSAAGKIDNSDSVSIDMECSGGNLVCVDDNFCIEVILAAFDFFRVSETKVDWTRSHFRILSVSNIISSNWRKLKQRSQQPQNFNPYLFEIRISICHFISYGKTRKVKFTDAEAKKLFFPFSLLAAASCNSSCCKVRQIIFDHDVV